MNLWHKKNYTSEAVSDVTEYNESMLAQCYARETETFLMNERRNVGLVTLTASWMNSKKKLTLTTILLRMVQCTHWYPNHWCAQSAARGQPRRSLIDGPLSHVCAVCDLQKRFVRESMIERRELCDAGMTSFLTTSEIVLLLPTIWSLRIETDFNPG